MEKYRADYPRFIQIMPGPAGDAFTTMYALDCFGDVWELCFQAGRYSWLKLRHSRV